jgi:putative addiction module killer protein
MAQIEIRRYRAASGAEPFNNWLLRLRDRQAKARVLVRIDRLESGNFGDCKALRGGVHELRIDWGPGYRVYFGRDGNLLVILLIGGDKRTQATDIRRALEYWQDYQRRSGFHESA